VVGQVLLCSFWDFNLLIVLQMLLELLFFLLALLRHLQMEKLEQPFTVVFLAHVAVDELFLDCLLIVSTELIVFLANKIVKSIKHILSNEELANLEEVQLVLDAVVFDQVEQEMAHRFICKSFSSSDCFRNAFDKCIVIIRQGVEVHVNIDGVELDDTLILLDKLLHCIEMFFVQV
jgi:hypothetical protein